MELMKLNMEQSISNIRATSRDSLFTNCITGRVLILGTPEQAQTLYLLLQEIKALEGRTHELIPYGQQGTAVQIQFVHSLSFPDDEVDRSGDVAYIFQPRTKSSHERMTGQFLYHIHIPGDVLRREINSIIAINYKAMTFNFFHQ